MATLDVRRIHDGVVPEDGVGSPLVRPPRELARVLRALGNDSRQPASLLHRDVLVVNATEDHVRPDQSLGAVARDVVEAEPAVNLAPADDVQRLVVETELAVEVVEELAELHPLGRAALVDLPRAVDGDAVHVDGDGVRSLGSAASSEADHGGRLGATVDDDLAVAVRAVLERDLLREVVLVGLDDVLGVGVVAVLRVVRDVLDDGVGLVVHGTVVVVSPRDGVGVGVGALLVLLVLEQVPVGGSDEAEPVDSGVVVHEELLEGQHGAIDRKLLGAAGGVDLVGLVKHHAVAER